LNSKEFAMEIRQIIFVAAALTALPLHFAAASPAVVTANVNLRAGPGTANPAITTIPAGAPIDVAGCEGQWCQVTFQGQSGFVIATSVGQGGPAGAPPPGYGAPPPPPVYVAPPPYYGSYYGYGPYYGWHGYYGGYWHRRW
jgi:SH3-like domain-containing protein